MNKEMLKKTINDKKGKSFNFVFNGSRNQIEKFSGKIVDAYSSVFLIKTNEENPRILSFSYNDIISSSLEIYNK